MDKVMGQAAVEGIPMQLDYNHHEGANKAVVASDPPATLHLLCLYGPGEQYSLIL